MDQIDERVLEAIREAAAKNPDGKITCGQAWHLAEDLQIPRKVVGEVANTLKIKIRECQLGCF